VAVTGADVESVGDWAVDVLAVDVELDVVVEPEELVPVCAGVEADGEDVCPDTDAAAVVVFGEPAKSPPSPIAAPSANAPATIVTDWTRRTAASRLSGEKVLEYEAFFMVRSLVASIVTATPKCVARTG
jgi:hypothetical protein